MTFTGHFRKEKICEVEKKLGSQHTFLTKKLKELDSMVKASYVVS